MPCKGLARSMLISAALYCTGAPMANAAVIAVSDVTGLRAAVAAANPGDEIVLAPGIYILATSLPITRPGTPAAPIHLRAQAPRAATIQVSTLIGFRMLASDWRIEGLAIEGTCTFDNECEHAIQILGNGDRTVLRDNHLRDFNVPIKGNGEVLSVGGSYSFADDVLIEGNRIYATRPRATSNPVTAIDAIGGRRWVIRGNQIFDLQKLDGDGISFIAVLRGNSRDGVFERNLAMCTRGFSGGIRLGLSLGGGGTPSAICEDADCTTEHQNGILRNNLILNCTDVGIFLNRAAGTTVAHNTLFNTTGIDLRFPASTATVRNNASTGAVRNRDGATSSQTGNLNSVPLQTMRGWFVNPDAADFRAADVSALRNLGAAGSGVVDDQCGDDRDDGVADIGALEYDGELDCDTRIDPPADAVFANGFE